MPTNLSVEDVLARLRSGDGAVLDRLPRQPDLVARLAERSRSNWTSLYLHRRLVSDESPAGLALASLHRDGHLREAAVRAIADRPYVPLAPFLVLRAGDWVPQVREPARQALRFLLAANPDAYVPAMLPMALRTAAQQRTGYALAEVQAAAQRMPEEKRLTMAASPYPELRRLAFETGVARDRLSASELLALALREADPVIRHRAAVLITERALQGRDAEPLRALTQARSAGVRALGFSGLVRVGRADAAVPGLTDPAPIVRAIARDAARRSGTDSAAFYRAAVREAEPSPAAVAGLAEGGRGADAALLEPLLRHPSGAVRAASLRGLAQLDAVPVPAVLPLLHDPAAAVVREASLALRPFAAALPDGFREELMGDPRPEVRLAGFRLAGTDPVERFRFAALLALDRDPALARRGRTVASQYQAWAGPWYRRLLRSTTPRRDALLAQIEEARPALGERTDVLLDGVRNAVDVGPAAAAAD